MPTDLTTVRDHPATLLEGYPNRPSDFLREYETEHGITFAALDNDALAQVRAAYAGLEDSPARRAEPVLDLMLAVCDLLGLAD